MPGEKKKREKGGLTKREKEASETVIKEQRRSFRIGYPYY
jgi:hypothetical protein